MEACGPEGTCSRRLYPSAVVKSVKAVAEPLLLLDPHLPIEVDPSLELDVQLQAANFKDAAMIALEIENRTVMEIDVLRSREVIKRHRGDIGSICFVVRRPG